MFNHPPAVERFGQIQRQYGYDLLIETGTHRGTGTLKALDFIRHALTFEINIESRLLSVDTWLNNGFSEIKTWDQDTTNRIFCNSALRTITSVFGSSGVMLCHYLEWNRLGPAIFYLDAHWNEYWPLLDELKAIAEARLRNSVIIIHDFKVPGTSLGHDSYAGQDLDWDYVKGGLSAINPKFKIEYNSEGPRGILYALP